MCLVQVLLTIGMWCARLKYHPTWGIPGTQLRGKTLEQQIIHLGRGWEWWPSVLWQVIWTWMVRIRTLCHCSNTERALLTLPRPEGGTHSHLAVLEDSRHDGVENTDHWLLRL